MGYEEGSRIVLNRQSHKWKGKEEPASPRCIAIILNLHSICISCMTRLSIDSVPPYEIGDCYMHTTAMDGCSVSVAWLYNMPV